MFWHPRLFHDEIRTEFYKIQTVKQFWDYTNSTLADNLFVNIDQNYSRGSSNETGNNDDDDPARRILQLDPDQG